jgi:hypothetical protein
MSLFNFKRKKPQIRIETEGTFKGFPYKSDGYCTAHYYPKRRSK